MKSDIHNRPSLKGSGSVPDLTSESTLHACMFTKSQCDVNQSNHKQNHFLSDLAVNTRCLVFHKFTSLQSSRVVRSRKKWLQCISNRCKDSF